MISSKKAPKKRKYQKVTSKKKGDLDSDVKMKDVNETSPYADILKANEAKGGDLDDDEANDLFSITTNNKTSSNTLTNIQILDGQQVAQILDNYYAKNDIHSKQRVSVFDSYRDSFTMFKNELKIGFNLLFYGYGSKKKLLEEFVNQKCKDGLKISYLGYLPTFTIKDVLNSLLFGSRKSFSDPLVHCDFIKSFFKSNTQLYVESGKVIPLDHVYLIIHNIDGPQLRSDIAQKVLSNLAEIPQIHIIASIDHINANFLWDTKLEDKFRWCRHSVPTFERYEEESAYDISILNSKGAKIQPKGIQVVLKSLSSVAKEVFIILLQLHIKKHTVSSSKAVMIAFTQLFNKCVDELLVDTEASLKSLLSEFIDHNIIQTKTKDSLLYLHIPITQLSTLEDLLDSISKEKEKDSLNKDKDKDNNNNS